MKAIIVSLVLFSLTARAQESAPRWDPFLDTLQQRTIQWFLRATPEATGLTPDRWPSPSPSSIAAVGFALTVYPIAAERGMITREEAAARVKKTSCTLPRTPAGPGPRATEAYSIISLPSRTVRGLGTASSPRSTPRC